MIASHLSLVILLSLFSTLGCTSLELAPRPARTVERPTEPQLRTDVLPEPDSFWCFDDHRNDELSSCGLSRKHCEDERVELLEYAIEAGFSTRIGSCKPQPRAACFTQFSRIRGIYTWSCQPDSGSCLAQRNVQLSQRTQDVSDVSSCYFWPFERGASR